VVELANAAVIPCKNAVSTLRRGLSHSRSEVGNLTVLQCRGEVKRKHGEEQRERE
jgi:hypothetical protein